MASITKKISSNGEISYKVCIRKKGVEIYKTFFTEEDAKLYEFYKENLIQNMDNFDVPISERITLNQIIELKLDDLRKNKISDRYIVDFNYVLNHIKNYMDMNQFVCKISYNDWINVAKNLLESDVYRGAKTEIGKRKMSISTLRRIFACISSAYSFAMSKEINIENLPLKVLQVYIYPMMKTCKNETQN